MSVQIGSLQPYMPKIRTYASRRQYMLDWQRRNHNSIKKEYEEYKLKHGCKDCGYRENADALEFDHLPGNKKSKNVSEFLWKSRRLMYAEIAKCELVCSNCHSIRTAKRIRENYACMGTEGFSGIPREG